MSPKLPSPSDRSSPLRAALGPLREGSGPLCLACQGPVEGLVTFALHTEEEPHPVCRRCGAPATFTLAIGSRPRPILGPE
jgi:hypothetical protein